MTAGTNETLGEALPRQIKRVRDEVMPAYIEIGAPGRMALAMMRLDLDRAAAALASGDIIEMIRAHESLKGYSL